MGQTPIRVTKLAYKRKRTFVLSDVTTSIDTGSLGVLGPNGSGKSTLLSLIATALKAPPSTIFINGLDIASSAGRREARRNIGYQPQKPSFVPSFTVEETVAYAAWLKGVRRPGPAVAAALEAANISNLAKKSVSEISGGQQKRVSIAQGIVHRPAVILLDEPTASLDPHERNLLLQVLDEVSRTSALVISTHDARDVADLCSRVLVLREGISVYDGEVTNFVANTTGNRSEGIESAYSSVMGI